MEPPDEAPEGAPPGGPQQAIRFPPELPITARHIEIAEAIHAHQVIIVAGETGSGKTTQLPKICLAMGRGVSGYIGCTQPRRLAATSVAQRVSKELGTVLGEEVGYKIRFGDKIKKTTYVKFMTDGILLAEVQGDALLRAYDTIIIDEAHERSLNIDFLLGYVKRLLPRRPDLRVIISSATLEVERFSAFFGGAPVLSVSGRTYPVEVVYRPPGDDEAELSWAVANTIMEIDELDRHGDILVFLPGEREIREAMDELSARPLRRTVILPLFARLGAAEQQRIFQTLPERRIILATNVAETSLTIPGIVYVVDAGLARINRYSPRTGVTQLLVEPIARASADQRKGRSGRTESGVCFRLYEQSDYEQRQAYTDPEIKRTGLSGVILRMKSQRLGEVEDFPFLDPPSKRAVDEGYRVLEEIGAIDEAGALLPLGHKLARFPLDPRLSRMILGGEERGALSEVLVIASALSVQDPRERPLSARQAADEAHRRFRDESSDFLSYLRIWAFYAEAARTSTQAQLRRVCRDSFLSFLRMREWVDIHQQLARIVKEMGLSPNEAPATEEQVHRALLPGLLSRIGMWHPEQRIYIGARQTRFALHPASSLSRKPPAWVVAAELVETSQLFARAAARIDPLWLEEAGGALCKRSYSDPHWEQKPAQAMAKEQASLFGLPFIKQRKVHYGPIDPRLSRALFIRHALVERDYETRAPFMQANTALLESVKRLRDKARRSDMLADDEAISLFFEARVPDEVYSGKTFEDWRKEAEARDPGILVLSIADVLQGEAGELTPERYPEALSLAGASLPLSYRFDPGEDDDGITVTIPLVVLPQLDPAVMEWTIAGWHLDKITSLLYELPKASRRALGPIPQAAAQIARATAPFEGPMLPALEEAAFALSGASLRRDEWNLEALPPYLRFNFRIIDDEGHPLAAGRDLADLKTRFAERARQAWGKVPKSSHARAGLTSWDFDALAESVEVRVAGRPLLAYPALVDHDKSVELCLLESPEAARAATALGLRRLYMLQANTTLAQLEQRVPGSLQLSPFPQGPVPLRRQIAARAIDEAFDLERGSALPRTKAAFVAKLEAGKGRLGPALSRLSGLAQEIASELGQVKAQLKGIRQRPGSPKAAMDDIEGQLSHLAPADLFSRHPTEQLRHVPRYLRAVGVRLARLPNDPVKDQDKASQVVPFWQEYLQKREALVARGREPAELEAYRWLIEELRVSIFALELRAAVPVSAQRLKEQWLSLTR